MTLWTDCGYLSPHLVQLLVAALAAGQLWFDRLLQPASPLGLLPCPLQALPAGHRSVLIVCPETDRCRRAQYSVSWLCGTRLPWGFGANPKHRSHHHTWDHCRCLIMPANIARLARSGRSQKPTGMVVSRSYARMSSPCQTDFKALCTNLASGTPGVESRTTTASVCCRSSLHIAREEDLGRSVCDGRELCGRSVQQLR